MMAKLRNLYLLLFVLSLLSCSKKGGDGEFHIKGVWELQQLTFPDGDVLTYTDNGSVRMRIYDDSCYYSCQTANAPNGTMIAPSEFETYTLVEKGQNTVLYLQGNDIHPLTIINDSTMVIQEDGVKFQWKQNHDFDAERCRDIIGIIRMDKNNSGEPIHRYVFSKAEKQLETTNHALIYIIILIGVALLLIINYARILYRNKKRVELELQHLEKERQSMPEPVRQALDTVKDDFHKSDFYISLRKRIVNAEHLKGEDWNAIENNINSVYPRFTSTLLSLYNMSQVEYQVCLLLKLNATPSEIAGVLCKDASTISCTRSRLYQKVFGKKGSSKAWDEFILSL